MLLAHAMHLAEMARGGTALLAGVYDYFSWQPATLNSVSWGRTRLAASLVSSPSLVSPQLSTDCEASHTCRNLCSASRFCNCSPGGSGYSWDGWDLHELPGAPALGASGGPGVRRDACFGPFAFPKGAFKLFSAAAVNWLVASKGFAADVRYAERLALGAPHDDKLPRIAPRLSEDAQMGFWFAAHPSLRLVQLRRFSSWANSFHQVGDLRRLLVVHRTPWDLFAWLLHHLESLWRAATELLLHHECSLTPPCKHCVHHPGQRVCALYARLRRSRGTLLNCHRCRCSATQNGTTTSVAESPGRCVWRDDISRADSTIASCML